MRKRRFGDGGGVEEPSIKGWLKDRAQWAKDNPVEAGLATADLASNIAMVTGAGLVLAPAKALLKAGVKKALPKIKDSSVVRNLMTKNKVAMPKGKQTILTGRMPTKPSDVTFGIRNMSQSEVDDIIRTGRVLPGKGKQKYGDGGKHWNAADKDGHFDRSWKETANGESNISIRAPIEKINSWGGRFGVSKKALEKLNKATGEWEKFKKGGAVSKSATKPKKSTKRKGDGICTRGHTKGRMR
tara:strand:+ start:161 stop:886 length:726 start_codon:yes stop_codon:yes gene_type:complete